jgi:hypothetical protein
MKFQKKKDKTYQYRTQILLIDFSRLIPERRHQATHILQPVTILDSPLPSILIGISTALTLPATVSLQNRLDSRSSGMRIVVESPSDLIVIDGEH